MNIPKRGYVGVGRVVETSKMVKDFMVEHKGKQTPILELDLVGNELGMNKDDPEKSNYAVRIEWIATVPRKEAYWEKGLFASQHTACKLRNQFTIECLTQHFKLDD